MYSLYITPPLPACIMYDCREGCAVIIGNTQSVSIPFLFLFFFHQSSLYPIKIPYSGYFSRGSIFAVVRIFVLLKIFAILIFAEPRIHDLCTFRRADDRWRQFKRMPVFEATMCTLQQHHFLRHTSLSRHVFR